MNTTQIEQHFPGLLCEIEHDTSGDRIRLKMRNGTVIVIAPDNDAMFFFRSEEHERAIESKPDIMMLVDLGADAGSDETIIVNNPDIKIERV